MDMEEHKPITLQCTLKHTGIIQNNGPHSQTILSKKFVLKTNAVFKVDLYSPRQVFFKCKCLNVKNILEVNSLEDIGG